MRASWIALTIAMLVVAASCDRERAANLTKEARRALTAKGMAIGAFNQESKYPASPGGREQVQCAAVSRKEGNCRICLVSYENADVAIRAANSKLGMALPDGSVYFVRGKTIFVVEPGPQRSMSLVQEVYDELRKLP